MASGRLGTNRTNHGIILQAAFPTLPCEPIRYRCHSHGHNAHRCHFCTPLPLSIRLSLPSPPHPTTDEPRSHRARPAPRRPPPSTAYTLATSDPSAQPPDAPHRHYHQYYEEYKEARQNSEAWIAELLSSETAGAADQTALMGKVEEALRQGSASVKQVAVSTTTRTANGACEASPPS